MIDHGMWAGNDIRGGEGEDTVSLGDLGLGLEVSENGVLVELSMVR